MKAEIKEKWITALTDGSYKQGSGALHHEDTFCCLGVLCDLYIKETGGGRWLELQQPTHFHKYSHAFILENAGDESLNSGVPPEPVDEWAGLRYAKYGYLTQLNDGGSTFAEIAEYIKENL